MTKRKLQISMVFLIVILCYFSYQFGSMLQESNFSLWKTEGSNILASDWIEKKKDYQDDNTYPKGGNKGLIHEEVIIGYAPLIHDSLLHEEIEDNAWFISENIKRNTILDDDRDDLFVSSNLSIDTIDSLEKNEIDVIEVNNIKEDFSRKAILTEKTRIALAIDNPSLNIEASSAVLMDARTGKVLYHKNAVERVYPASTVKIMTAIVALMHSDIKEEVTVGEEIKLMASDSSRAYLNEGEILTMGMLLEALLLPSGNDAAYVIANYIGSKLLEEKDLDIELSVETFVSEMNRVAIEYGLENTHFMNPDGYDHEKQFSSAYDMAIIARYALEEEEILRISKMQKARNIFPSGEDVTWKSGNRLIQPSSGVYYKYAIGLKSGTSSLAGRCMVSAGRKEDDTVISVVLNSSAQGRWNDSLILLKEGIQ